MGEDEDELERDDELERGTEEALLVETLMGWDGDRCRCPACECPRFIDEADQDRCRDCREGRHWGS